MTERRRGGGPTLNRTETVTVRFNPLTKQAAKIAAAKEDRTLSSFIEMVVKLYIEKGHKS